jgi:hypothetical protein
MRVVVFEMRKKVRPANSIDRVMLNSKVRPDKMQEDAGRIGRFDSKS